MTVATLNGYKKASTQHCDPESLCSCIERDFRVLERFRTNRVRITRQMVGAHYSEEGAEKIVPIDLLAQYAQIVGRNLIAKEPRAMLSTSEATLKPAVKIMQQEVNKRLEQMQFAVTEQRIVLDAMISIGIAKVSLTTPVDSALYGWNLPAGAAAITRIDLDDWVYDTHAHDFSEASYLGHRYRVPLDAAREFKHFSAKRKELQSNYDAQYNPSGDERISMIGRTSIGGGNADDYEPMVDLWEVYLPRKRLIVTMKSSGDGGYPEPCSDGDPLREQEWIGPDCGPYHILGFGVVPGNAMPTAPLQNLLDLHEAINRIYRKLIRQADRQKIVLPVKGASEADITRLNQTDDGMAFRCDGDAPKEVDYGGPGAKNTVLVMELNKRFNELAGNLALLGGSAPQSPTATQDEILTKNSTAGVADKQDYTLRHIGSVVKALCWYWWHDPVTVMKTEYVPQGLPPSMGIQRELHPYNPMSPEHMDRVRMKKLMRDKPWGSFEVRVDPHSLKHQTPQERLSYLRGLIGQVQPLMPLLQQQGIMMDVNYWLSKEAEYSDTPDVVELFKIQEPPVQEMGEAPEQTGMPESTTRNYVRESRSQKTQPGQDTALQQALLTGKSAGGAE